MMNMNFLASVFGRFYTNVKILLHTAKTIFARWICSVTGGGGWYTSLGLTVRIREKENNSRVKNVFSPIPPTPPSSEKVTNW